MSEGNFFESRTQEWREQQQAKLVEEQRRETELQQARWEEAERQRERSEHEGLELEATRNRVAQLFAVRDQKNQSHQGTAPSQVWGEEEAELCRQFLGFAAKRDYAGATLLNNRLSPSDRWSIRGYGIACIAFAQRNEKHRKGVFYERSGQKHRKDIAYKHKRLAVATNLSHNVFLCTDEELRLYTNCSVPAFSFSNPTSLEPLFSRQEPGVIADLPVNSDEAEIMVPESGVFISEQETITIGTAKPPRGKLEKGAITVTQSTSASPPTATASFAVFRPATVRDELLSRMTEINKLVR